MRLAYKFFSFQIVLGILLALGLALPFLGDYAAEKWLRPKIEAAAPGLKFDSIALGFFSPRLIFGKIRFESGDPRDSAVRAEVERAEVPVSWRSLGSAEWRLGVIRVLKSYA